MSFLQYSYIEQSNESDTKSKLTKLDINKTRKKPSSQRITNDYIKKIQKDMTKTSESDNDEEDNEIPYLQEEQSKEKPPSITNFQPPPMPKLHSNKVTQEQTSNQNETSNLKEVSKINQQDSLLPPAPTEIDDQPSYEQQYQPNTQLQSYVPYYNNTTNLPPPVQSRDELVTKLNYLIHMLEEQQEQKTGHVMEELILYCFLGVFIIFTIDSFVKIGKYTR